MDERSKRAQVAEQTLEILSHGRYSLPDGTVVSIAEALKQAVEQSIHYTPESFTDVFHRRDRDVGDRRTSAGTEFRMINATTLAAARELATPPSSAPIVCLNFASAKNPGGGFRGGSQAQEESLARASGLYSCLERMHGYYRANRTAKSCLYTDNMVYSPGVPVFRDDDDRLLPRPYEVAIITAPAVNAGAVRRNEYRNVALIEPTMLGRIEKVLSLAVIHGHRRLVLGAWGCGVFENDPAKVAAWFHTHLCCNATFKHAFDTVVFAVRSRTEDKSILRAFVTMFRDAGACG
jgi:uncharacterized protein (TIGR02452 family)